MHCTQCGTKLRPDDKFCAKCGKGVAKDVRARDRAPRPPFSNTEGVAQYNALIAAKRARSVRRLKIFLLLVWGAAAVLELLARLEPGTSAGAWGETGVRVVGALVVSAFGACWFGAGSLSESEYRALAGSRDQAGEHQCLHCGHRGVYIQGQYRTNYKHHNCSKCKAYHFTS